MGFADTTYTLKQQVALPPVLLKDALSDTSYGDVTNVKQAVFVNDHV